MSMFNIFRKSKAKKLITNKDFLTPKNYFDRKNIKLVLRYSSIVEIKLLNFFFVREYLNLFNCAIRNCNSCQFYFEYYAEWETRGSESPLALFRYVWLELPVEMRANVQVSIIANPLRRKEKMFFRSLRRQLPAIEEQKLIALVLKNPLRIINRNFVKYFEFCLHRNIMSVFDLCYRSNYIPKGIERMGFYEVRKYLRSLRGRPGMFYFDEAEVEDGYEQA